MPQLPHERAGSVKKEDFEVRRERHGRFVVQRVQIRVDKLPPSFQSYRIVQLTDLHRGPATSRAHIEEAVRIARELRPHLVLLTGDYIQNSRIGIRQALGTRVDPKTFHWMEFRRRVRDLAREVGAALAQLRPDDGAYAVLGNHDYLEGAPSIIRAFPSQVRWLTNESVTIEKPDGILFLGGIDDWRRGKPDIASAARAAAESSGAFFRLLITHNPDLVLHTEADALQNFDLMTVGHTHGGQICLPGWGPIVTRTAQKEHTSGLSVHGKLAVYTSSGVGYGGVSVRFFCPPEVTLFELVGR